MILIADSGSTKINWVLTDQKEIIKKWKTPGINPYFHTRETMENNIRHGLPEDLPEVNEVHFYCAGCKLEENRKKVHYPLSECFPSAEVHVEHDLLGAARSLCQHTEGIVCILGTGSNACLFDGKKILKNPVSIGYVLGDEGSGAVIGTRLLRSYLQKTLPEDLSNAFFENFQEDVGTFLDQVYRKPFPNRYLAGFAKFLGDHISHPWVRDMVSEEFGQFLDRNLEDMKPGAGTPIYFLGSVAFYFSEILQPLCEQRGFPVGEITDDPLPGMIRFHQG